MTALATRSFIVISLCVFSLFGYGCSNSNSSSTITAQFLPSSTPQAPLLVKLAPVSVSGSLMVIQAVIYGPDASLDLYAFAFDIKIGDPTMVKFVAGTAGNQNALTTSGGQTVVTNASVDAADASHIVVGVSKSGGGAGNGIAGTSAIVVQMTFQALKAGATTLAITGTSANPSQPPTALDSSLQPIAGITFDAAAAAVTATASGGGY
jgi:hypothetical protein